MYEYIPEGSRSGMKRLCLWLFVAAILLFFASGFEGMLYPSVMQMVSVIYMLTAMQLASFDFMPRELSMVLLIVGIVLIWVSVVATVVSGVQYVWALRHYFKES